MDANEFVKKLSGKGLENGEKEKEMDDFVKTYEMDLIKKHEAKKKSKNLKTTGAFDIVRRSPNENEQEGENGGSRGEEGGKEGDEMENDEDSKNDGEDERMDESEDELRQLNQDLLQSAEDPKGLRRLWDTFQKLKEGQEAKMEELKETFSEVEFQVRSVSKCVGEHQLLWKVKDFSSLSSTSKPLISPVFDSHRNGYKMQVILSQNKAEALSLHFCIWKGKCDPFLPWPFSCPMTFVILNLKKIAAEHEAKLNRGTGEAGLEHYSKHFDPRIQSLNSACLQRPLSDRNKNIGFSNFVSMVHLREGGFVEDDTVYLKVLMDLSDV